MARNDFATVQFVIFNLDFRKILTLSSMSARMLGVKIILTGNQSEQVAGRSLNRLQGLEKGKHSVQEMWSLCILLHIITSNHLVNISQ